MCSRTVSGSVRCHATELLVVRGYVDNLDWGMCKLFCNLSTSACVSYAHGRRESQEEPAQAVRCEGKLYFAVLGTSMGFTPVVDAAAAAGLLGGLEFADTALGPSAAPLLARPSCTQTPCL